MSVCKSCGAAIVWVNIKGLQTPVDAHPSLEGTLELQYSGAGNALHITAIEHAGSNGTARGGLHTSHFATCPFEKRGRP
jgi:hypothetical protein